MKRKKYNDIGKGKKLLLITLGASVITPFILLAISSLLYIGKELLKYTIKGKLEQYALQKGKLNEYTLVEKIKKEVIKECDDEMKAYRDEGMTDDEDYIYCERLKQNAMGWKTISDLERSPFSKLQQVKRAITAYHAAQNKLLEKARLLESKSMSRKDRMPHKSRHRDALILGYDMYSSGRRNDIIRNPNKDPKDIRFARNVVKNYQKALQGRKKYNYERNISQTASKRKEILNRAREIINGREGNKINEVNNKANARRPFGKVSITAILGGAALAVIIGLIVKKIRNAIKGNASLKKNAQQNNTDQRYVAFVENQIRNGQYNEPAIVNSIKAQMIPILEKELTTKYNSGDITNQEYATAKQQIENVKKANTLEEIYSEIKTPEIRQEIVAYRTAKTKIENELAFMQQHAAMLQSAFHDAGVKGMKRGQHIKAKDPDYVESLKGGSGGGNASPSNTQQSGGMSTAKKVGIGLAAAAGAAAAIGGGIALRKHLHNRKMAKALTALKAKAATQQAAHAAEIGNKLAALKKQAAYNKSFRGRFSRLASKLKEGGRANYAKLRNKIAEHRLKSQISRAAAGQSLKRRASSLKNHFSLQ